MVRRNLAPLLAGAELGQASLRDASLRRATRARAMALRLAAWVARAALLPPVAGLGPLSARDPPSRFFVGVACGWERWSIHMWPASLLWPRHHVRRQASLSSWRWRSSWLHPWAVKAVRPHTTQRVFWLSVRVQLEVRSDFVAESSETLVYDGDGNLVRDGRWVYSWDAENRLVRVMNYGAADRAGWRRVDWAYDALGRRIRQTSYVLSNGVWVVTEDLRFVSDPVWFGRHIAELNATNHAVVRSYVWALNLSETLDGAGGAGGLLWVRVAGGPASETHFVTYDGNGNVWQLLSASTGTEAARYEYGPFGEPLRATGPAAPFNPFRFSTKRTDAATRLVLYEFRACSPSEGRWLNRDPAQEAGGCNLYGWVQNNTVGFYDLDGREIGGICPKCGQYKTGPWCANCAQSPRPPAFCVYWRGFGKLMFRIDGPWCVWTATLAVDVCGGKCPKTLSIERKIPLSPRWQLTVLLCLCPPGPEFTRCSGKAP